MLALKAFFGHCPHFFVVLVAFFLILVAFFDFVVIFLLISYQSIFLHTNRHDRVTKGDTALKCATAFDEWMETLDHLHKASGQDGSPPLRGCKLLNFSFVKNMNIEALEEELDFIKRIPMANLIFGALKAELFVYKRVAMEAPPDLSSWGFWVKLYYRVI